MHTLDKHFRLLTEKVFAHHGLAMAELLIHWPQIAGPELLARAEPVKIVWPRGAAADKRKSGGTLQMKTAPGLALEIQYEAPRIVERINQYFGYGAIVAVRVVPGAMRPPAVKLSPPRLDAETAAQLEARLTGVDDEALRHALYRLGAEVLARAETIASPAKG